MAAVVRNPFQFGNGQDRSLIRPSGDEVTEGHPEISSIAATPRLVVPAVEPSMVFTFGTAQRIQTSNCLQAEIEPESSSQHLEKIEPAESVPPLLTISNPKSRFQKLQEYEGEVLSINGPEFIARLVDLTDLNGQELEATFSVDEISPSDESLFHEGAIFYWIIGSADYPNGQRKNESFLRFRRLPIWSARDIGRLEARANEMKAFLQSDD